MHDHPVLIFIALMVFLFGLVSKVSEKWLVSGPMAFVIVGVLVSPVGLDLFTLNVDADTVKLIAEMTLMLILLVDASMIKMDVRMSSWQNYLYLDHQRAGRSGLQSSAPTTAAAATARLKL